MEYLGLPLFGHIGMFEEAYPFHANADVVFIVVKEAQKTIAQLCLNVNGDYEAFKSEKVGFFGFFDAYNNKVAAKLLFDKVEEILKEKEITDLRGPFNFTYNHTCGVLLDAFEIKPVVDMPYNLSLIHISEPTRPY